MRDALTPLLQALAAGDVTPERVAEVRALVAAWPEDDVLHEAVTSLSWEDARADAVALLPLVDPTAEDGLGSMVREAVRRDDKVDLAGGVLGALGLDEGWPVADAVAREAGRVEVARAFDTGALPIAEAVAAEAGTVDLSGAVLAAVGEVQAHEPTVVDPDQALSAMLDHALDPEARAAVTRRLTEDPQARTTMSAWADLGRQLRTAVRGEAGDAEEVWRAVASGIGIEDPEAVPGWDESALEAAVAAEAGTVDVVDAVMAQVVVDRARDLVDAPDVPTPANTVDGWQVGVGLLVAALLLVMVLPNLVGTLDGPATDGEAGFTENAVRFATADEISVDRIATGDDASVFVEMPTDDDAPLIIWVDDGGTL